jgi:hypothetical protein
MNLLSVVCRPQVHKNGKLARWKYFDRTCACSLKMSLTNKLYHFLYIHFRYTVYRTKRIHSVLGEKNDRTVNPWVAKALRDVLQNGGNVHVWPAWRLLTRDSPSLRDTLGKSSCSSQNQFWLKFYSFCYIYCFSAWFLSVPFSSFGTDSSVDLWTLK